MTQSGSQRIKWVERVQTSAMLLVVLHHSLPHGYDGPEWLEALLNAIQYPALACFFFTAGLFAGHWKEHGWGCYLRRRAARLLIPWLCISLLMLAPRYAMALVLGVKAHLAPSWLLMSFLNPHGQGIAPHLWFLPTLFLMSLLLPLMERVRSGRPIVRLTLLAVLLVLAALPVLLPSLLCLNELKLYLVWFAAGYLLNEDHSASCPLSGPWGLALGSAGALLFTATLFFPAMPCLVFLQTLGGAAALTALSGMNGPHPLTDLFRGRTYTVYILSMCVQNLVEVLGVKAGLAWWITAAAMLGLGLAVPLVLHALLAPRLDAHKPFPAFVRRMLGI